MTKVKEADTAVLLLMRKLFSKDRYSLLNKLNDQLKGGKSPIFVATPNPEQMVQAWGDNQFSRVLSTCDILLPDGVGLVWASRILADKQDISKISHRIAGREVVSELLTLAHSNHQSVLVIGGKGYERGTNKSISLIPISLNDSKTELSKVAKDDTIYWIKDYQKGAEINAELTNILSVLQPSLVFVALGAPNQELLMNQYRQLFKQHKVKIVMAAGGSFDYLLGIVPRVPSLLANMGLEWLFRLISQPWRWRRQLRLVRFMVWVVRMRLG